jgi:dTDP-4-dehydrorhamnose 3,5-epimerase
MKISTTSLSGVLVLSPTVFRDERGFFLETFRRDLLRQADLPPFVQHNHSRSRRGVLRGLHFQQRQPQGKLVRAVQGTIFDVAADIRPDSPTFGSWFGLILDDENHRQLYIPPGLAHGFLVLSPLADVEYKCTEYYDPDSQSGIAWDDETLDIAWPLQALDEGPLLSEKDRTLPRLS